jgi:pheromone a factor receptor
LWYVSWLSFALWPHSSLLSVNAIYAFHKRERQFKQMMLSSHGPGRGRYLRLMALSSIEILGTIPLATYFIVSNAKAGVTPWTSWADIHSHYSAIPQVAGFIWKNDPNVVSGLEVFRWSLVACAFIFFAFFGIGDEARQNYRRMYMSLASGIGYLTSNRHGSSHGCVVRSLCLSV